MSDELELLSNNNSEDEGESNTEDEGESNNSEDEGESNSEDEDEGENDDEDEGESENNDEDEGKGVEDEGENDENDEDEEENDEVVSEDTDKILMKIIEGDDIEDEDEDENEDEDDEISSEEAKRIIKKISSLPPLKALAPLKTTAPKAVSPLVPLKTAETKSIPLKIADPLLGKSEKPKIKVISSPPLDIPTKTIETVVKPLRPIEKKPLKIQPTSVSEVDVILSPKPGKKPEKEKTVEISTTIIEEGKKKFKEGTLEDLLVKSSDETTEFFLMRSAYAKASQKVFPKHNPTTHVLIGYYGANRATYGITYPSDTENVLIYIEKTL